MLTGTIRNYTMLISRLETAISNDSICAPESYEEAMSRAKVLKEALEDATRTLAAGKEDKDNGYVDKDTIAKMEVFEESIVELCNGIISRTQRILECAEFFQLVARMSALADAATEEKELA